MFKRLKNWAEKKLKDKKLNGDIWFLEKDDWFNRGYWKGFIEGLESAERQLKARKIK